MNNAQAKGTNGSCEISGELIKCIKVDVPIFPCIKNRRRKNKDVNTRPDFVPAVCLKTK